MTTDPNSNELKSLSYRRYTIVNIRSEETLTPHLCVIVDDDEAFQSAKEDPHFQFVITDVGGAVRRGTALPLTLTHGHTFPATEAQIAEAEKMLSEDNETHEVLVGENESIISILSGESDGTTDKLLPSTDEKSELNEEGSEVEEEYSEIETLRPDLSTYISEECVSGEWTLEVPTAFIALSQLIFESHPDDAPAFLIASNKTFNPSRAAKGYSYDDFDFIVEYENHQTNLYSESTAEITRIREGAYIVSASDNEMGNAAAILLDKIVRIAAGEISAVHEASNLVDDFARLAKKKGQPAHSEKPKSEDVIFHTMLNLLLDMYSQTSTENVFNTLYESEVLEGYEDSVEDLEEQSNVIDNMLSVERLFESQGIHNLFADLDIKYESPKIPVNAKEADLAGFYSTPLTKETFPESMKALAEVLDFSYVYENNLLDNDAVEDIEMTDESAGSVLLGMIIALAVRYERLKEIQKYGLPFIPFNIFLKVFQDIYEANFMSDIIMSSIVNIPFNGTRLIRELAVNHMADERQGRLQAANNVVPGTNMPVILTYPSVLILHYLNHMVFDDGLDLAALSSSLQEGNPLKDYVEQLSEGLENLKESNPFGPEACPELIMGVDFVVGVEMTPSEIADAVIDLLVAAGELSVSSHTDFVPGSPEWQDYLVGFYQALIQK